jgi:hypothetical protein
MENHEEIIFKPWDKDQDALEWFKAAAQEVRNESVKHPEFPIAVDPDLAEFMGAFEDPNFTDEDLYPDDDYLRLLGAGPESPEQDNASADLDSVLVVPIGGGDEEE